MTRRWICEKKTFGEDPKQETTLNNLMKPKE